LITLRVCLLHHFEYGIRAQSISAKQKGASDEQLSAIPDFESGPFSEAQKLGFRYADRLHRSPAEIDDNFYAQVKSVYNHLQIIELTAVAAAFEFFPRFIDGLRIPITPAAKASV
jgi:alkylhydroperoxidase family enzyme